MSRRAAKKRLVSETFAPTPQSSEELALAHKYPLQVVEILSEIMTPERLSAVERAVSHRTGTLHLACEGVHDPHNTAAIIRTADAFGVLNVHIIEGTARFRSSAAVTQGAHKWLDISVYTDTPEFIETMRSRGVRVLVAAMDGAYDVHQMALKQPTVLVFGNESEGISRQMRSLADGAFRIPMYGFVESFNVSVAAAISTSALRHAGQGDLDEQTRACLKARYCLRSVRAGVDICKRRLGEK